MLETRKISEIHNDIALTALIALGAFLRILYVGRKSYWWDEIATVQICSAPFAEFWRWLWRREANMSFYYILLRPWIHFGDSEARVRLLSVAFAIISIPLIYLVGVQTFGRKRAGLMAAFLLSLNTAHVAYAQEARSYALLMLLCLLSLLFFVRLPEWGAGNTISYVLVSALAVYANFFAVFFLCAQWSSLFWLRKNVLQWKKFLLPASMTVALISPALYYMLFRRSGQLGYVPAVRFKDLSRLIFFLVADGGRFHRALALLYILCCGVAVRNFFARCRDNHDSYQNWGTVVMICCVVIPVIVTFTLSFWLPMFAVHYLLICLPPLVLLAAGGLAEFRSTWLQLGVCALIVLFSAGSLSWYYAHPKDEWRSMAAYLIQHAKSGDGIVGCPLGVQWPVQHYVSKSTSQTASTFVYMDPATLEKDVNLYRSGSKPLTSARFWVVTWGGTCDTNMFTRLAPEYERISEQPFFGVSLTLYSNQGR